MNISLTSFLPSSGPQWLSTACLALGLAVAAPDLCAGGGAPVAPPSATPYGKSYGQWSASWWQWALSQPLPGHPFVDDSAFDVSAGQSGPVWFLATPFGTVKRCVTIPRGKSLFVGLMNAEGSDLEGLGTTDAEQREAARFQADHITSVACRIDGVNVPMIERFRVESPQFGFTAPSPWIFGETGGTGTSVGDGYFLFIPPLSKGWHTIRIKGGFLFSTAEGDPFDFEAAADVTYHIRVH